MAELYSLPTASNKEANEDQSINDQHDIGGGLDQNFIQEKERKIWTCVKHKTSRYTLQGL